MNEDAMTKWTVHRYLRETAAWALALTCVFALFGLSVDAGALLVHGYPARVAFASGITGAGFAAWAALVIAPIVTLLGMLCCFLDARVRWLGMLPIALVAYGLTLLVSAGGDKTLAIAVGDKPTVAFRLTQLGFIAAFVIGATAARSKKRHFALAVGATVVILVHVELFIFIHKPLRDARDLLSILGVAGAFAVFAPLRHRIATVSSRRLAALVVVCGVVPYVIVQGVDRAAPGWGAASWQYALYQPRLARFSRALIDFDLDGYSPVAWGTDCDDFDRKRGPGARESRPGVDMNCNGATLPEHPSDADRGLLPPFGNPDLDMSPGALPLVVLVTIDCWRADAFRRDVMPNLTAFAERGVVLERLYSAGSRTISSMRLIERGFDRATALGTQLGEVGVASTAIFPFGKEFLNPVQYAGFTTKQHGIGRWNAAETTDVALEDLRTNEAKPAPHLLWVHYIDAHTPYRLAPAAFPYATDLDASYATYLAEVAFVDRELARLLDALSAETARPVTVIVTGDHGEGFGRHNVRDHGISGYEELIHVPGIVVAPGLAPGRYKELVSHRDIAPTILGAFGRAGASPASETFGRSWLRLRASPSAPLHKFVVTRSARAVRGVMDLMPMAVLVERDVTLIETFEDGLLEVYAPLSDPTELHDLAAARPEETARLHRELALFQDIDLALP